MRDIQNVPHYTTVTCQTLSPCGDLYAACSDAGMVAVWTVESIRSSEPASPVIVFNPFNSPVYSLTCTDRFLIAGGSGEVRAWHWKELAARNSKSAWSLNIGRTDQKTQINWMDTNKQDKTCEKLVLGCGDKNIYVHDVETREQLNLLTGHTDYVHSVDVTDGSGGVSIVSGGEDGSVKLWDTRTAQSGIYSFIPDNESELSRPGLGKFISSVSTAGDWLVCGGGPAASLWNLSTRIMSSKLPPDNGGVFATQIFEEKIFVGGQNSAVHTSNYGGEECGKMNVKSSCIYSIVTDLDKDLLAAAGSSTSINIFSIKSNTKIKSLSFPISL